MNDQIKGLISQYEDEGFFTRVPPAPEMIEEAQEKLGVKIPDRFLEYLNIYSYGGGLTEPKFWESERSCSSKRR